MAQKDKDLEKIEQLLEIMKKEGLAEIEIKHGDDKIHLKRAGTEQPPAVIVPGGVVNSNGVQSFANGAVPVSQESAQGNLGNQSSQQEDLVEIKSSIVGTFYSAPSPDSEACVEIGSHVGSQTVVCIIEAMKVMNEIKAETSGTITDILVTNGQAVEYGQVLFRVKPD